MDWILVVLILTSASNFHESHSHYLASFSTEQLCTQAAEAIRQTFEKPSETGIKVDVRAACSQRKK